MKSNNFQPKSGSHYRLDMKLCPLNQWIHIRNVSLWARRNKTSKLEEKHSQTCYESKESAQEHRITGGAGIGMCSRSYTLLFISAGILFCTCSCIKEYTQVMGYQATIKVLVQVELEYHKISVMFPSIFQILVISLSGIDMICEYELV